MKRTMKYNFKSYRVDLPLDPPDDNTGEYHPILDDLMEPIHDVDRKINHIQKLAKTDLDAALGEYWDLVPVMCDAIPDGADAGEADILYQEELQDIVDEYDDILDPDAVPENSEELRSSTGRASDLFGKLETLVDSKSDYISMAAEEADADYDY